MNLQILERISEHECRYRWYTNQIEFSLLRYTLLKIAISAKLQSLRRCDQLSFIGSVVRPNKQKNRIAWKFKKNVRQPGKLPNVVLVSVYVFGLIRPGTALVAMTGLHQFYSPTFGVLVRQRACYFTSIICRVCVKLPALMRYRYTPLDRFDASKFTS